MFRTGGGPNSGRGTQLQEDLRALSASVAVQASVRQRVAAAEALSSPSCARAGVPLALVAPRMARSCAPPAPPSSASGEALLGRGAAGRRGARALGPGSLRLSAYACARARAPGRRLSHPRGAPRGLCVHVCVSSGDSVIRASVGAHARHFGRRDISLIFLGHRAASQAHRVVGASDRESSVLFPAPFLARNPNCFARTSIYFFSVTVSVSLRLALLVARCSRACYTPRIFLPMSNFGCI